MRRDIFKTTERRRPRARRALALAAGALLVLAGAACDNPLQVDDPEFLTPGGIGDEEIDLLINGARSDFQVAYSGIGGSTDRGLFPVMGLFTDELFSSGTFTTRTATDQRAQQPISVGNTSDSAYVRLHRARRSAIRAVEALEAAESGQGPVVADMKFIEGLTVVALAESFCPAVPVSDVTPEGDRVPGVPLADEELYELAIGIFDQALAVDPGNHAAAVGKGRALLDLGRYQEAAAAVASVPTSFVEVIEHSANSTQQENPLFNLQSNGRYSVSDLEGGNGLPFRSAQDPRVPWVEDPDGGFDASIPLFLAQKYSSRTSPVVVADGIEARLIEAEAALNGGDVTGWLSILNALRADVRNLMTARVENYAAFVPGPNNPTATLDPLSDPGGQEARIDLHFQERAFWLYLTGHRLGDLRRLIRQYGRTPEATFPTGAYFKGGSYGNDVSLPLDFSETNNPNFTEEMCDVDVP